MAKYTVEQFKSLDVRWLAREHFRGYKPGSFHISVKYTWTENENTEELDYEIGLTTTPCNYGGFRWWFLCPKCRKRVAKLYLWKYFYCRHCHNLTYRSCQEHDKRFSFWEKDMSEYTETDCKELLKQLRKLVC